MDSPPLKVWYDFLKISRILRYMSIAIFAIGVVQRDTEIGERDST